MSSPPPKRICDMKVSEMKSDVSSSSGTSEVTQHASWFADHEGNLYTRIMTLKHKILGITVGVDFKCKAIESLLSSSGCPFTAKGIASINNPAKSGIWDNNGHFNKSKFDELVQLGSPHGVTRSQFNKILPSGRHGIATWVRLWGFMPMPIAWSMITQASLDELFKYYADTVVNENGVDVPAISVSSLHLFYSDPHKFFSSKMKT